MAHIAKQVKLETVVDRASLDAGQFKADGGFTRLNKVFDGKLEALAGKRWDAVIDDSATKPDYVRQSTQLLAGPDSHAGHGTWGRLTSPVPSLAMSAGRS